ncbi:MAG TPA: serine/threonine-protein kinase, partial [Candidatus Saccharimonadales bacterium]|nr:serine/threonine-protein kinase [Candidatus Saccharimonadales bacterium]
QSEPGRTPPPAGAGVRPAPPTPAEIAQFFPQLEILELSGQGGMGMIYKARQPQLDRIVALKILSPELSTDPAFAERFSREAQALAKLNHSNIVSVFDFGQSGRFYYFLMEFVDGVNLHSLIQERQLHASEAQRIVIEVCHALQFAHEEGIVHRDIKPSNILIDKKGRVKIADFGLAKLLGTSARDSSGAAQTTLVMGTPHYMAPEQVEKPGEVDHRADIYSLGVVFYEMLTGELPLGRFEPPSKKAAVDARLDDVVMCALEKDPQRRYQQAGHISTAVQTVTGSPALPVPPAALPVLKKEPAHWSYLRQFGLMAGVALLTVFFYVFLKDHWPWRQSGRIPPGAMEGFAANPEGPVVGKRIINALHLTKPQTQDMNRIIRHSQREFVILERRWTEHTKDSAGHVHITIKPFPADMSVLMDRMWKDLAGVLSSEQLAVAQTLHLEKLFPHTGEQTVNVEIWREPDGEYHYVESRESSSNALPVSLQHPPQRYRSYLPDR